MLPKINRVNKGQIDLIFNKGKYINSPNLTFKFIISGENKHSGFSFIVPKTVSKKAIVRNRLKRRGYAVLARYIDKLPSNLIGAFVFGKKSANSYGLPRKKNSKNSGKPVENLDNEIKILLNKLIF
ncbi:ribonuclease P protein component [Candidatus Nomurabacteria bacterium]|nr:ribonuclease P protein component [Candidatus Nomurabacteria bacterium]